MTMTVSGASTHAGSLVAVALREQTVPTGLARTSLLHALSNTTGDFPGGTGAYVTPAFIPRNNSLLVVSAFAHGSSGGSTNNFATEGFTISDSAGLTWTERAVAYGDTARPRLMS